MDLQQTCMYQLKAQIRLGTYKITYVEYKITSYNLNRKAVFMIAHEHSIQA